MQFILAPFFWYLIAGDLGSECSEIGSFIWIMPTMGAALLVCYIWGRHYANRLDYANMVKSLLEISDEGSSADDES